MEQTIILHPAQHDFFVCQDRIAAYIGGIRSGKSFAGVLWAIEQASVPGAVVLIVAPTYPMLRDIDWVEAQKFLGTTAQVNKSEMTMDMPGGGRLMFRSADSPDRIRGISANAALIDEAGYCPADTYDIVLGRLSGAPGYLRIVTTPKGRNWLYTRQGEMTTFRSTTFDNPYLPPEYLQSVQSAYTGNFARQELYGEFVAFEGLVYPMFSRDANVKVRDVADFKTRWFGNDEGYTNPSVILDAGIDSDRRMHIFREWYRRGQLQDTVVAVNAEWYNDVHPAGVVVDSSAAGLIAALQAVNVPATGHKGRVQDGIGKVQNMLVIAGDNKPRLTIDPSCVQTIAEFESYCWKDGRDEPEKQNDHAMDSLRYIVDATTFGKIGTMPDPFE